MLKGTLRAARLIWAAEVRFPAGELGYDTAYAAIEFERAAVDIEPMEVVATGAALA